MNRTQKILLGIASFLPIVLGLTVMVKYLLLIKQMMLSGMMRRNDPAEAIRFFQAVFSTIVPFIIAALIVYVVLLIIYILHAARNQRISDTERVIWIIAFFVFSGIAFPIYFFLRIAGDQGRLAPGFRQPPGVTRY